MAEERIYIFRFEKDPCDDCETKEIYPDCNSCPDKEEYSRGITPKEAIERMAKALIRADYPNATKAVWERRWENPDSHLYYLTIAEAALNAIAPIIPQEDKNER